ncbi:MAG: ROK family protein, partial [Promethearchaeota archaeon]
MKYYIGVDIGGSNIRTIFGTDTEILLKLVSPTRKTGPVDTVVSQVIEMIEHGMKVLNISKEDLYGIGTSSASPFVDGGTRIWTPNISGVGNDWKDIPYMIPLKNHFGEHLVYSLANDCVSSVKAEQLFGAGKGFENLVYVTISTGVGGGIIANNHLVEGKSRNAAHVGHLIVEKDGDLCGCGQRGCIESIASGKAIARRAKERGLTNPEGNRLTTKEVFDLYRQGNPTAQALINETIEYLGVMFSGIISI